MGIAQVAFEITPAVQKGLDNGTLFRYGGVVRDAAGHIATHLKEVPIPEVDSSSALKALSNFAKKNKHAIIGAGIGLCIFGVSTYIVVKNSKNEEVKVPKCIMDFNVVFMEYINSIKNENVTEEIIDKVMMTLDEIQTNQDNGSISIEFSIENVNLLLEMVRDYTMRFAKANKYEILEDDAGEESEIINLKNYLEIQKSIFTECA